LALRAVCGGDEVGNIGKKGIAAVLGLRGKGKEVVEMTVDVQAVEIEFDDVIHHVKAR
jgi:hypothetical protein